MKYTFFGFLLLCAGLRCSAPAPQKNQALECYVRYLVPEAQLSVEATLFEWSAGEIHRTSVEAPGGISYQNIAMTPFRVGAEVNYQSTQAGGYTPEHMFRWKDAQRRDVQYDLELAPITAFSFDKNPLPRDSAATFRWDGKALEKGESLVFLWEREAGNLTVPMEVLGSPGQTSIDFPAAKLKDLEPGAWTLYLVRKKAVKTDIQGIAASALLEFYTRVDTIQVR
ncbi:MAG: hypothetical protein IT260_10260 [Saprospiraceae bacterium]|nr:hypothetical protein [Saprospiraceae bacterium]